MIGKTSGELTVVALAGMGTGKDPRPLVKCRCSCGRFKITSVRNILAQTCKSCGCVQSWQEIRICDILKVNGLKFEREVKFDDCRNLLPLPFDFAVWVDGRMMLLEYHGDQHYHQAPGWTSLELVQYRDSIKREYCEANGIPLLIVDGYTKDLEYTIEWFIQSTLSAS